MMEMAIQDFGISAEVVQDQERSPRGAGSFAGILARELSAREKGNDDPQKVAIQSFSGPEGSELRPPDATAEQGSQVPGPETEPVSQYQISFSSGTVQFHNPSQDQAKDTKPISQQKDNQDGTPQDGIPQCFVPAAAPVILGIPLPNEPNPGTAATDSMPSAGVSSTVWENFQKDAGSIQDQNSTGPAAGESVKYENRTDIRDTVNFATQEPPPQTSLTPPQAIRQILSAELSSSRIAGPSSGIAPGKPADSGFKNTESRIDENPPGWQEVRPQEKGSISARRLDIPQGREGQPVEAEAASAPAPQGREGILIGSSEIPTSIPENSAIPRLPEGSEKIGMRAPDKLAAAPQNVPPRAAENPVPPAFVAEAQGNSVARSGVESLAQHTTTGREWMPERPPLPKGDHGPADLKGAGVRVSGFHSLIQEAGINPTDAAGKSTAAERVFFAAPNVEAPDLSRQVGEKMIWSLKNNQEKISLVLNPPELGSIYLEIHRDKESIKTTLWAEDALTKSTLESSHLQIQKIVENEGFHLEKFSVFIQQERGSFGEERRNPVYRETPEQHRDKTKAIETPVSQPIITGAGRISGNNSLDLFV